MAGEVRDDRSLRAGSVDFLPSGVSLRPAPPAGAPAFLYIAFPNDSTLMSIARSYRNYVRARGLPGEMQRPAHFHITLMYLASATEEQLALLFFDRLGFPMKFRPEFVRPAILGDALVLLVDAEPGLLGLQRSLWQKAVELGCKPDDKGFSNPEAYKPHLTILNQVRDFDVALLPVHPALPFHLSASHIVIGREAYDKVQSVRLPASAGDRVLIERGGPWVWPTVPRKAVRMDQALALMRGELVLAGRRIVTLGEPLVVLGGPGSHPHAGRPGQVGGSAPGEGGSATSQVTPEGVDDIMRQFVESFQGADVEHGVVIKPDGEVIEQTGSQGLVITTPEEAPPGSIEFHNHPTDSTFSTNDIATTLRAQFAEMRVVNSVGDQFILRNPNPERKVSVARITTLVANLSNASIEAATSEVGEYSDENSPAFNGAVSRYLAGQYARGALDRVGLQYEMVPAGKKALSQRGGTGSGHFGHGGRPGERGGSTPSGHREEANRILASKYEKVSAAEYVVAIGKGGAAWLDDQGGIYRMDGYHSNLSDDLMNAGILPNMSYDATIDYIQSNFGMLRLKRSWGDVGLEFDPDRPMSDLQIATLQDIGESVVASEGHFRIFADTPSADERNEAEGRLANRLGIAVERGGPGSGHRGHAGRPGQQGGSAPGEGGGLGRSGERGGSQPGAAFSGGRYPQAYLTALPEALKSVRQATKVEPSSVAGKLGSYFLTPDGELLRISGEHRDAAATAALAVQASDLLSLQEKKDISRSGWMDAVMASGVHRLNIFDWGGAANRGVGYQADTSVTSRQYDTALAIALATGMPFEDWRVDTYTGALETPQTALRKIGLVERGGPGSGNRGHAGRPGEVGGSAPDGGSGRTPGEGSAVQYGKVGGRSPDSQEFKTYLYANEHDTPESAQLTKVPHVSNLAEAAASAQLEQGSEAWQQRRNAWEDELGTLGEATLKSGIWIGPSGKPLGPDGDHQSTALALLRWDLHRMPVGVDTVATDAVIEGGLVRYNLDEQNIYFDIPSIDHTTDSQWAAMAALVTQMTRDEKVVPGLTMSVGGAFHPTASFDNAEVYEYLDLNPTELAGEFDATILRGGAGSGHFAHEGRPGERGGSAPGGGTAGISPSLLKGSIADDLPTVRDGIIRAMKDRAGHVEDVILPNETRDTLGYGDYWILSDGTLIQVSSHDRSAQAALDVAQDAGGIPATFREFFGAKGNEYIPAGKLSYEALMLGLGLVRWSTSGQQGVSTGGAKMTDEQAGRISEMAGKVPALLDNLPWEAWEPTVVGETTKYLDLNHGPEGRGVLSLLETRGGPGSGHFGHEGRPGERGGSAPGGPDTWNMTAEKWRDHKKGLTLPDGGPDHSAITAAIQERERQTQEAVWRFVAEHPSTNVPSAADSLGVEPSRVGSALQSLREAGRVTMKELPAESGARHFFEWTVQRGGPGSGHFAHAGRPGERGGSAPGQGTAGRSGERGGSALDEGATVSQKYARAGATVDGRAVGAEVANQNSIAASLDRFRVLPDIREVPILAFENHERPTYYSKSERERTQALADRIRESNQVAPLIVVEDKDGPYILEGGHRYDALLELGATSLPAMVVLDLDSLGITERGGPGSGHFAHEGRPGERGGSAPGEGGPPRGGDVKSVAHASLRASSAIEPKVTSLMRRLAEAHGGEMHNLEFRLKSEDSLARKIVAEAHDKGLSLEEATKDIVDVLRYTMVFEREGFVDNVLAVQQEMEDGGWEQYDTRWTNYFKPGDAYDGYNTAMFNPETGEKFELQFHTPDTARVKEGSHVIYQRWRDTAPGDTAVRAQMWQEMTAMWRDIKPPDNWENLPGVIL